MMPPNGKPIRRGQRRAWRGLPRGRHATRVVETTCGRHQRQCEHETQMSALIAVLKRACLVAVLADECIRERNEAAARNWHDAGAQERAVPQ
jgi:hypothetical protein